MLKRAIHVGTAALVAAAIIAGASGCGAPAFTYVKNSKQKTYFKVPHDWHEIGTKSLDDALSGTNADSAAAQVRQEYWWSVAYDAASAPSTDHLLTSDVTEQPIVYARVAQLTDTQQNEVSLDLLRNVFLPVTDEARQEATAAGTLQLTGFELVRDEVLTPSGGLHGVRVVYDYELANGVLHTFDQTALVNNAGTELYLMIIRCSTSCYRQRSSQLDTIATSFTVRSDR